MSRAVKEALTASKDLKPTDRLVLVAIISHQNANTGTAWPSVPTIAEYVGCSIRTVQRAIGRLVKLGRLVVSQVKGIATRVYRLVTAAPSGVTSDSQGVTDSTAGGDSQEVSPEVGEEDLEEVKGRKRPDWRRFLPKTKPSNPAPTWERRGAALPPAVGADRCQRHLGELAHNCRCCRAEALAGDK
ncbi:helix-turn-helix domain-containing protein [Actinoplanes sp. NPDC051861]|uniref:helix-turn-helix domain-containing protein n=1 Tax=Actinoplanes sp. NPDC051861 TaxID=3155170 RepID=UPI00341E94BF